MNWLHALRLGISRHPIKFLVYWFAAYSVIWTLLDSAASVLSSIKVTGALCYLLIVLVSLIFALVRAYPPSAVQLKVPGSVTRINVSFGDVFTKDGFVAIPVNEFFDSELGDPVSPHSLHGIVINRHFGGHPAAFDQLVATELAGVPCTLVERVRGKTNQYPVGTAATVRTNSHKFILFALCKTDIATFKASSTIPHLVQALECLCAKARNVLGGTKLIVPLTGAGLSGLGLPPDKLLQLILLVLANETKKSQFALEIEVVVHPDKYDDIDLCAVEAAWR